MTELNKRLQAEIEHGKKIAENAEEVWNWETGAGKVRADKRSKHIANFLHLKLDNKVLEIGCGTGLFTDKISKLGGTTNILATDLSPDLIEKAKEKYPHLNFEVGDAMNIEQPDGSFDAIFGNSIVHHLDFDLFLNEMFRLLKPGGKMCFAEPNMLNPQIFVQKNIPFIKKWLGDSPDESAINRFSFKKQLLKKGFHNVQVFPFDFLHPSIPKALINPINFISNQLERIPLIKEIGGSVIIYAEKW
jgi:ubiquinone/menaquinone biosynthesis C-methylase UbiE